jgi:hypothetical protein
LALSFVISVRPLFDLAPMCEQVLPQIIAVEYYAALTDGLKEQEGSGVSYSVEPGDVDLSAQTALQAHGKLDRGLGVVVGEGDQ